MVVEEMEDQMGRVFLAYVTLLTAVYLFWYMGLMLLSTNNDWPMVEQNLRRVRGNWEKGRLFWEGRELIR